MQDMKSRYIASCVFTRDYPELSLRIQDYLKQRFEIEIIRYGRQCRTTFPLSRTPR